MIYEILVRPTTNKQINSDHVIWIDSNLPSRHFERWLREKNLLDGSAQSPVQRWSIKQTTRPAHFDLSTEAAAIQSRIAELIGENAVVIEMPEAARALEAFRLKQGAAHLLAA